MPYGPMNLESTSFVVAENSTQQIQLRTGRPTYDENNNLLPERIWVVEIPDFDIESLIGKCLIPLPA